MRQSLNQFIVKFNKVSLPNIFLEDRNNIGTILRFIVEGRQILEFSGKLYFQKT